MDSSGLFSAKAFMNRDILKLAPDAFVVMNNAFGNRVIAPMDATSSSGFGVPGDLSSKIYMQGGVTSIGVNCSVSPAGAGKASIEVIAPQYKGMHNDYYIDMPNGVRIPYFLPMTEVKIFMKGRFIESDPMFKYKPQYYPVFWGFITGINENYSGGASTFSISCSDMLSWWSFQKLTLKSAAKQIGMGAPAADKFPTVFQYLNPWETIYALFLDTFFVQGEGSNQTTSNFAYANWDGSVNPPYMGDLTGQALNDALGGLALKTTEYWSKRFGFQSFAEGKASTDLGSTTGKNKAPIEMFGLQGPVELNSIADTVNNYHAAGNYLKNRTVSATLNMDFSILSRVQPYGQYSRYGDGSVSLENTKLEIANKTCEDTHMEFFLDCNGSFVFKPPFYNLDVAFGSDRTYVMESGDIINYSFAQNTDAIVNMLEVTGPYNTSTPEVTYFGMHIDYKSIERYGLRNQKLAMNYGNTPETLRAIAVSEMARINAKTKTGSLSIPLRPEMRMGYPIYIRHIDAFYYVTGLNHSLSYGASATTELIVESRRDRVYDDGEVTGKPGVILKGYVVKFKSAKAVKEGIGDLELKAIADAAKTRGDLQKDNTSEVLNNLQINYVKETKGLTAGNNTYGFTEIVEASKILNPDVAIADGQPEDGDRSAASTVDVKSNELIHITKETIPYTDINGYEHIGSFPYGANLRLDRENGYSFVDMSKKSEADAYENRTLLNISPDSI